MIEAPATLPTFIPRWYFDRTRRTARWRGIVRQVAERHGITVEELLGPCRARRFAWPRQEAAYRLRTETPLSFAQIGERLGGRDHTTIIHAIRAHERRVALARTYVNGGNLGQG